MLVFSCSTFSLKVSSLSSDLEGEDQLSRWKNEPAEAEIIKKITVDSSRRQDNQGEPTNVLRGVGGAKHPHGGQWVLGTEDPKFKFSFIYIEPRTIK